MFPDFGLPPQDANNPAQPAKGNAGKPGLCPGFDMGGAMDMMNGEMADAMNCMEKEMEVSCQDETYRKQVSRAILVLHGSSW